MYSLTTSISPSKERFFLANSSNSWHSHSFKQTLNRAQQEGKTQEVTSTLHPSCNVRVRGLTSQDLPIKRETSTNTDTHVVVLMFLLLPPSLGVLNLFRDSSYCMDGGIYTQTRPKGLFLIKTVQMYVLDHS